MKFKKRIYKKLELNIHKDLGYLLFKIKLFNKMGFTNYFIIQTGISDINEKHETHFIATPSQSDRDILCKK